MADHDVLRDDDAEAVTLTPLQVRAVWHAINVVEAVRREEGYESMWTNPQANLAKSRLLGRMLIDGRPPLPEKPPNYVAACGYHFVEPDLPHYYLGTVFLAEQQDDGTLVPIIPMKPGDYGDV